MDVSLLSTSSSGAVHVNVWLLHYSNGSPLSRILSGVYCGQYLRRGRPRLLTRTGECPLCVDYDSMVPQYLGNNGALRGLEFGELYQGKCKVILELGPTVARHIQTMILHSELFCDGDPIHPMNHQDKTLQSIPKDLKKSTLEIIGLIILRVVQCAYDSVAEIQPEGMAELLSYSHLLTHCTFYHRMVRNITGPISKGLGQELWDCFSRIGILLYGNDDVL